MAGRATTNGTGAATPDTTPGALFLAATSQNRGATHEGLALFGLHYWDPRLAGIRSPDRQGRPRRFQLRYDPTDISCVAVFENGLWLGDGYARELRLPDGRYEATSLWELRLAKERAHEPSQQRPPHPQSWLVHLLEARELITQRAGRAEAHSPQDPTIARTSGAAPAGTDLGPTPGPGDRPTRRDGPVLGRLAGPRSGPTLAAAGKLREVIELQRR